MLDILFNLLTINSNIRVGFKHNYIMKVQVVKIGAQVSVSAGFLSITLKLDEIENTYESLLQFARAIIPQTWKDDMGWDESVVEKELGRYIKYVPEAIALIKGFDCNYEVTFKEDGTLHYNIKDFTGGIINVQGMYLLIDKVRMDEEAIREERRAELKASEEAWEAEMKAAEDAAKEATKAFTDSLDETLRAQREALNEECNKAVEALGNSVAPEKPNTFEWDEENRHLTFHSRPTIAQLYYALQCNDVISTDRFLDLQTEYVSHEWNSVATSGRTYRIEREFDITILVKHVNIK
jgi:hypothetical protein